MYQDLTCCQGYDPRIGSRVTLAQLYEDRGVVDGDLRRSWELEDEAK